MDHYTPFSDKNSSRNRVHKSVQHEPSSSDEEELSHDDAQSRLEYIKSVVPPLKHQQKWPLIVLAIVIGIGLIAGGGYLYSTHHKATKTVGNKTATQTVTIKSQPTVSTTTHYVSNGSDLNLDFDYPSNWNVSPPSDNNSNDQTITLNSPLRTIIDSAGASITGKVTVSIRPGTASMDELNSGAATAGQASVQFAYSKPTSAQFQYPYLTFIELSAGNNPASAFQEVLISGTTPFAKSESITTASVAVDPIITASFYSCLTVSCTGNAAVPLSITSGTWQNNIVFQQTLALFESLQLN